MPYRVGGMCGTSSGDLAIVEKFGRRARIVTINGTLVRKLTVPGASKFFGIDRQADRLFIVDEGNKRIHVITEINTFIVSMYTDISEIRRIVVTNRTLYVAADPGLYKLTFDASYSITTSTRILQSISAHSFTGHFLLLLYSLV